MSKQNQIKPLFSNWKYVLIVSLLLIGFGFGCKFDYQISNTLFAKNNNWFVGVIVSNILFVIIDFLLCCVGLTLVFSSNVYKKNNNKLFVIGIIIGLAIIIALNVFFGLELRDFDRLINNNLWILICVLVPVVVTICSFIFSFKFLKNKVQEKKYYLASLLIIIVFAIGSLVYLILMPIWSRPRPLWEFDCLDPTKRFRNWWELQPFARFTADKSYRSYLASFPSGHTSATALIVGIVICLDRLQFIKNKKISKILFWLSILLMCAMGISRVMGGNHHFSDVCLSGVMGATYNFVPRFIKVGKNKR